MNRHTKLNVKLEHIPLLPGIYKMMDSERNIIYVGKSKCLKKRIKTYFTGNHKGSKIERLVLLINDIDYIVTDTHLEARLLECKLIKEIKPFFNSQMKNDEKYVYLNIIEVYNPYNALTVEAQRTNFSYGPFRQKHTLYRIIDGLRNLFPIINKNNEIIFEYNAIPLVMNQSTFNENKKFLIELFSDEKTMDAFINVLKEKMEEAAFSYKYEIAAKYRDIIQGLNYIKFRTSDYAKFLSQDYLLKIPIANGFKLFLISGGDILFNKILENPTKADIDLFINTGYTKKQSGAYDLTEKAALDYRDIIYSEIKSLPKEYYEIIKSK